MLHAGGKFGGDDSGYKVSGGLHGVGISVVNALSETLNVQVVRDESVYTMNFGRGQVLGAMDVTSVNDIDLMSVMASGASTGTKVTFKPDPLIFKTTTEFEYDKLASRLDELAYLNAGITITMVDKRSKSARKYKNQLALQDIEDETFDEKKAAELAAREKEEAKEAKGGKFKRKTSLLKKSEDPGQEEGQRDGANEATQEDHDEGDHDLPDKIEVFRHDGGIKELIENMCEGKTLLHEDVPVISIKEERKGVAVEVALRWSKDVYTDSLTGFANGIRTIDGGSHLDGLKASVTRTLNQYGKKIGKIKEGAPNIPGEFLREGLTGVISVKVPEPEFEGQTKTRLGNPEVRTIVDSTVQDALNTLFDWNPSVVTVVVTKALEAQNAALAAKAAREMVRRKSLLGSTVLPGKLADCASRKPEESEIYIVEGDSAAGSAKQGRDRRTQAILPLRGKILNIERASNEKIYQNTELQALISALGLGVRGVEFDIDSLRYHKIVLMTDADVDGAHIRILLLTFFYRYQREVIEKGFVYVACPPLYKVTQKGTGSKKSGDVYMYDQQELDEYLSKMSPSANMPQLQRFKGLGEMMALQLWDTTMNPETRTLKRVSIEDAMEADKLFTMLMGDNVAPRKEFITTNAEALALDDLDF